MYREKQLMQASKRTWSRVVFGRIYFIKNENTLIYVVSNKKGEGARPRRPLRGGAAAATASPKALRGASGDPTGG